METTLCVWGSRRQDKDYAGMSNIIYLSDYRKPKPQPIFYANSIDTLWRN
jgi:hypothetical protein